MSPSNFDEKFLHECFRLAKLGETQAFPNPIVGTVIVHNNLILGKGFHRKSGEAHAEVNAIQDAIARNPSNYEKLLSESDIYVSLEPCNHHGKTPPCIDLIKKYKFKRLIFSTRDPNPDLNSAREASYKELLKNGTEIIGPKKISQETKIESDYLNRVFFHKLESELPWINIKIASYADGSMITKVSDQWITNSNSRKEGHRLRSVNDLLITGINTVKMDNPSLNVRYSKVELKLNDIKNPDLLILKKTQDFSEKERRKLNIFTEAENRTINELKVSKLKPKSPGDKVILEDNLFNSLQEYLKKYPRIILEAGPKLTSSFIKEGLFNEITHYISLKGIDYNNHRLVQKIKASILDQHKVLRGNESLQIIKEEFIPTNNISDNLDLKITVADKTEQ